MEKSTSEILDGYAIAKLKSLRIGTELTKVKEAKYLKGFNEIKEKFPNYDWDFIFKMFDNVNDYIWKYEAAIRLGVVDHSRAYVDGYTELVREFNTLRTAIGNLVCMLVGEDEELNIKKDHISEGK